MRSTALLTTTAVFLAGSLSYAATPQDAELLRILEQKGYLSSAEVEEIRTARTAGTSDATTSGIVVSADSEHLVSLRISGNLQFQYDGLSASHRVGGATNHVGFRRALLGIDAALPNDWYISGAFDFARGSGGDGMLDHMVVGWRNSKELDVSVGYDRVPFGYETTLAYEDVLTVEISPMSNFFAETLRFNSFHAGGWVKGELDEGLSYSVSAANAGRGYRGDGGNGYSLWGRLQYATEDVTSTIGNGKLMIGLDLGYQSSNVNGGNLQLNSASIFGYSGYARLELGQLMVLGEVTGATVQGVNGFDRANPLGATATVGYTLDQFQPIFQYSFIDGGGIGMATGDVSFEAPMATSAVQRLHSVYLGGNYYIMGNDLRVSGGLVYLGAPASGGGSSYDSVGVRAQLQVLF